METQGLTGILASKENVDIFILCGISQFLVLAPNETKQRRNITWPNKPQSQMAGDGGFGTACDM